MIMSYSNRAGVSTKEVETKCIVVRIQGITYTLSEGTCGGLAVSKRMSGQENTHLRRTVDIEVVESNRVVVK